MKRAVRWALGLALAIAAVLVATHRELPSLAGRSVSTALQHTAGTRLGQAIEPLRRQHAGQSGIAALAEGEDAFAVRMLLADAADRSIDVQYYIWHGDRSGILLFDALRRAADRGVRVRLLLDDNNTGGLDPLLAALDAHPRIEVRLFNPFVQRRWRMLGYLTDFPRLNRRMHNKSFTVDNQATVVGGRNVGDEYFGAGDGTLFMDLDVLAIGPVVADVSREFDQYWASASSYPLARIVPPAATAKPDALERATARIGAEAATPRYLQAIAARPFVQALLERRLPLEWAQTRMVADDAAKGLGLAPTDALLPQRLAALLGTPQRELDLVSPYFVPGSGGTEWLAALARRGVKVSVLTNSLEATDVAAVHAGYARRRKPLLEAGVQLFELKRTSAAPATREHGFGGSSASSLHAKTFAVDGNRVFVGSFNFDPRSARLNTEMGFVIDSPALARRMTDTFADLAPQRAYTVHLDGDGDLQWLENDHGTQRTYQSEPGTGAWKRAMVRILSLLPIEWLL